MVLGRRGSRLFIGGADPTDQEAVERIKFATQLSPEWVIVEYDKLGKLLEKPGQPAPTRRWSRWPRANSTSTSPKTTARHPEQADVAQEVEDAPVVRFLQKMLIDAINARASDLHFEPYEYNYRVRFRVDGELREITQPPIAIKDKLASRIKVISRLDIAEKRVPQDGRMKLKFGNRAIDFRVSTLPTLFGEKIVIRILDPSSAEVGHRGAGLRKDRARPTDHRDSAALRHDPGDRPDGLGQDRVAVHLPEHPQPAGRQHLDGRRTRRKSTCRVSTRSTSTTRPG